jgi:hypothetical protein
MDYTRAEPCFAGVLYGWRNGIWDVMRTNINNVGAKEETDNQTSQTADNQVPSEKDKRAHTPCVARTKAVAQEQEETNGTK